MEKELIKRSGSKCELCGGTENMKVYEVPPNPTGKVEESVYTCDVCFEQIEDADKMDVNHWRCLNDSMWSEVAAVQVVSWRMLQRLKSENWAQDLLEMLYLSDETLSWAEATGEGASQEDAIVHLDSNGTILQAGDTVVLIKSLDVKGTSFIAKRGTSVRGISLVADNPEHIEGRVNGQRIVILTKFVKKSG